MSFESGNVSISTENIFPIIKKWLYSEKDIFIRELISNSSDAINKLQKLAAIGEATVDSNESYSIKVVVNNDDKTIQVIDNGIGMSEEEIKKYINQIAFSGAKDFLEKYKDKADDSQIIGHFGLGFYSSFMVADKVQIDTKSYDSTQEPVRWTSNAGTEYEISESDRNERGTTVTLYLSEDSQEYLNEYKMREVLLKYFSFLPTEIFLEDASKKEDTCKCHEHDIEDEIKKEDACKCHEHDIEDLEDPEEQDTSVECKAVEKEIKPLNDTTPLWLKNSKDCTDEEYKDFYKKVFNDYRDPLFWIHLNMDYPFKLKGILYFPKLKHELDSVEGQIKLYYNQVFVADNIKEVIPEFLLLLKGTIDCPDLPLNVSRSFLQNDGYVSKISTHITKKVADKLTSIYENDRESYNKYWDDISPFVKYGCIKEAKFFEKVKDIIIYKTTSDDYVTLTDYALRNKEKNKDKVFYVTDIKQQAQYINMFKQNGMEAVILSTMLDNHYVQFLETKEHDIKFTRIDSDLSETMKDSDSQDSEEEKKELNEKLEKMFKNYLGNDKLKIQIEALKSVLVPGIILLSEQSRRMQEMSKMFGGMDMSHMFGNEETLVLNRNNNLIKTVLEMNNNEDKKEDAKLICEHIYDLALISHRQLEPEVMTKFVERSNEILQKVANM